MRRVVCAWMVAALAMPAPAWNSHGHRTVTYLAFDRLPPEAPSWLRESADTVAFLSNQADRWRGWRSPALGHEHKPDHFLNIETLAEFGLTLRTLPPLRNEYLRAAAVAKYADPQRVSPYDAADDPERAHEFPGFLPHAILEQYVKLQATLNDVRVLEKLADPQREFQLLAARQTAQVHMGMLSHFVGDAAQPLHTTRHYNGWVGDNPAGFTENNRFHAYIDGGVLAHHGLNFDGLRAPAPLPALNAREPWDDILSYIERSHSRMIPLYELEKDGRLLQAPGREFVAERLNDAGGMLGALIWNAYVSAAPNDKQMADFVFYDNMRGEEFDNRGRAAKPKAESWPPAARNPASRPASAPSGG